MTQQPNLSGVESSLSCLWKSARGATEAVGRFVAANETDRRARLDQLDVVQDLRLESNEQPNNLDETRLDSVVGLAQVEALMIAVELANVERSILETLHMMIAVDELKSVPSNYLLWACPASRNVAYWSEWSINERSLIDSGAATASAGSFKRINVRFGQPKLAPPARREQKHHFQWVI